MKIVLLSGSRMGSKTRQAIDLTHQLIQNQYEEIHVDLIDLAEKEIDFADGHHYLELTGDAGQVTQTIMESDALIIGSPIFQASLPGSLKNIFDLLPQNALRGKTVGIVITAGSPKHYLIAEYQLKPILTYMKAMVLPSYVFIEETDYAQGKIINQDIHYRLENLIKDTILSNQALQLAQQQEEDTYDF
ncbi:NAD(P)H-dependent oxidoreductase [Facklamia sp. DSM 111018]|uniref:NAD(P)H-dependent oxidoreductase n=1 Tax=Facklamia lactis TaxID=2749967 RepID=A0ABS0LPM3_9LACT|nr:NADPH-dependent FMN reductase [Facklamia lactis]MBG9986106.1 NAD(P)H-dependent oxidoreductase [Facklamia lactis]